MKIAVWSAIIDCVNSFGCFHIAFLFFGSDRGMAQSDAIAPEFFTASPDRQFSRGFLHNDAIGRYALGEPIPMVVCVNNCSAQANYDQENGSCEHEHVQYTRIEACFLRGYIFARCGLGPRSG